jgi:hypothetical protein
MNSQRLEEFRRKLRAGDAVRVHKGQIEIDGTPQAATTATPPPSAATPAAPAAAPSAAGVQVKPHEWGRS